jgi:hypothetical protein
VEHVVLWEGSIWKSLHGERKAKFDNMMQAANDEFRFEPKEWREQAKLGIGLLAVFVVGSLAFFAFGAITEWTFDIEPWFSTQWLEQWLMRRAP